MTDKQVESRHNNEKPIQTNTAVLDAFVRRGGFTQVNTLIAICAARMEKDFELVLMRKPNELLDSDFASVCIERFLRLFHKLVKSKTIMDSPQTSSMFSKQDRLLQGVNKFVPSQLVVEVRMAILPSARMLWESEVVERGPNQIAKELTQVIRIIASGDGEGGAFTVAMGLPAPAPAKRRKFKIAQDLVNTIAGPNPTPDAIQKARDAVYRCNNQLGFAIEFYKEPSLDFATPLGEIEEVAPPAPESVVPETEAMDVDVSTISTENSESSHEDSAELDEDDDDDVPEPETSDVQGLQDGSSTPTGQRAAQIVYLDDLDAARTAIRENLINRCLDVVNSYGEVTFEIADLITAVIKKAEDATALRKDTAGTLVIALISFVGQDTSVCGKKIAAYAHLLALMLRDKDFFVAAIEELKDNLDQLLTFIQLPDEQSTESPCPWVSNILLIVELLLSSDERPPKTTYPVPTRENEWDEGKAVLVKELPETTVSEEHRAILFQAVLEMLPRVGKDESLGLAVLRILIILTRNRSMALAMGEKKNMQRLFVMAKQLAGSSPVIQGPLLIVLRHVIEDAETIKQIIRSEIRATLDTANMRSAGNMTVSNFLRCQPSTALRAPDAFVEVTGEMCKLSRWSYAAETGGLNKVPIVVLNDLPRGQSPEKDDSVQPTVQATEDLTIQDVKVSTEEIGTTAQESKGDSVAKLVGSDNSHLPVIENPDGVIHFLLCELLNYKDVADKEPVPVDESAATPAPPTDQVDPTKPNPRPRGPIGAEPKPPPPPPAPVKGQFKAEDHPIHVYRRFLLQCLSELLGSYNRAKLEFINFKRSAPPQGTTPSKPRSSVVNYLLYDLLPTGTINSPTPDQNVASRKKANTSFWANQVLIALLAKTGEKPLQKPRVPLDNDDETDLLFVRRFVLDNVLKAFKDACNSTEELDFKYSRLLALSSLMTDLMGSTRSLERPSNPHTLAHASQDQLKRLMFEKGYIPALTTAVADVDLNFESAKRIVKYLLQPLNTLTATAVDLCNYGLISDSPQGADMGEIESATSVSDPEEGREETPDLFRNSTLGMFEHGDGEESSDEEDGWFPP